MRRGPAVLAPWALAVSLAAAPARASCPTDPVVRGGEERADLPAVLAAGFASDEPDCRVEAFLLAGALADTAGPCGWRDGVEALAPRDPAGQALLAAFAWRCGWPELAAGAARRAARADPSAELAWRVLGQYLASRWRPEAARAALRRALELDPSDPTALWYAAEVAESRAERLRKLETYLDAGARRGEPPPRIRAAADQIAFLHALGDRPVWRRVRSDLPAEIPLLPIPAGRGRVAGWLLRAAVGKRARLPLLLDSGASGLHLDARAARSAGMEELAPGTLVGGGGRRAHSVRRGLLSSLDLGPLRFEDALGVAAAGDLHPRGLYRGLIGFDLFSGLVAAIDPRHGRLRLVRGENAERSPDPLAREPAVAGPSAVPLYRIEGQLLAPVTIAAGSFRKAVLAVVDTGAARTILSETAADGLPGLRRAEAGSVVAYGGVRRLAGRLARVRLALGGTVVELEDVPVLRVPERARMTGVVTGGFIGLDALARRPFALDLARGLLLSSAGAAAGEGD